MDNAKTVVVATHNAHKVVEIESIMDMSAWRFVSLEDAGVSEEAVEDADSFEGNARIKARFAYEHTGHASLADDSGIVVDALGGAPGIYSARYSGEHATDADNNAKLLLALKDVPETQRSARFMCVMVFIDEDGSEHVGRGSFEGRIAFEEHGSNGFGYDPLFLTQGSGYTTTSAELPADEKNAISHRALALADLKKKLV